MSQQVLELPGGPVEIWRSGEGPAVLVAHGCGSGGSFRLNTWLAAALPSHQVISVSRPGYGQTPLSTAATFHEQAAMYVDVLDAIGTVDCTVIGMSASGPIALLAARDYATRFRRLVLWCAVARGMPSHRIDVESAFDPATLAQEIAAEVAAYDRAYADETFARSILPELLSPTEMNRYDTDPSLRADIRSYFGEHLLAPAALEGVLNDMRQLNALLQEGLDASVHVPTLIMHGSEDTTVPVEHARYHAEQNATAELEIVEGAGHGFMHSFRGETITRLRTFLLGDA
jgi:pimeloyl-ACP methyl ester carboxylesterase